MLIQIVAKVTMLDQLG